MSTNDFNDDFASAADYAYRYYSLGLEAVPAVMPHEAKEWKRPALNNWRSLQQKQVNKNTFDSWFAPQGRHATRTNIGILTGECSDRIFCLDFDFYKGPEARLWLDEMLIRQKRAGEIEETATQTTGGAASKCSFELRRDGVRASRS
jgi:hypothetical protein